MCRLILRLGARLYTTASLKSDGICYVDISNARPLEPGEIHMSVITYHVQGLCVYRNVKINELVTGLVRRPARELLHSTCKYTKEEFSLQL